MSIADVISLLEAECPPDKQPNMPGKPTVNSSSNTELLRTIAGIAGRRRALDKKTAALKKAEALLKKKATKAREVKVACAKLDVKAAQAKLQFTLTRYDMLKKYLDENGSPSAKTKAAHIIAWGDPISADGAAHHSTVDDENAPAPGPIPDIKYDGKQSKVVTTSGADYEIPNIGSAPSETKVAELKGVAPAAPKVDLTNLGGEPPTKKKQFSDVNAVEQMKLVAKVKGKVLDHVSDHGYFSQLALDDALAAEGFAPSQAALDAVMAKLKMGPLTGSAAAEVAKLAAKAVKDSGVISPSELKKDLISMVAVAQGKLLPPAIAHDMIQQAMTALTAKPKSWDQLTDTEQQKVLAAVKKEVLAPGADASNLMQMLGKLKTTLAADGLKVSDAALSIAAGKLKNIVLLPGEGLSKLPADVQQAVKEVAKKAVEQGQDVGVAVANAGIAKLSQAALDDLKDEVGDSKKPDEAGFLAAMQKLYENGPITFLSKWPPSLVPQEEGLPLSAFMAQFGLDIHDYESKLKSKVTEIRKAVFKKKWKAGEAKAFCFKFWDEKEKAGLAHSGASGKKAVYNQQEKFGYPGSSTFSALAGETALSVFKGWYDEWKKAKKPASATPAPTVPVPSVPSAPANVAAKNTHHTLYKKISKPSHLTGSQNDYIEAKIQEAIANGVCFTKTGKKKASLNGIAKKIRDEFKGAYAPAGVSGIGNFVAKMLEDALADSMSNGQKHEQAQLKLAQGLPGSVIDDHPSGWWFQSVMKKMADKSSLGSGTNPASLFATAYASKKFATLLGEMLAMAPAAAAADAAADAAAAAAVPLPSVPSPFGPAELPPSLTMPETLPDPETGLGGNAVGLSVPQMLSYVSTTQPPDGPPRPDFSAWDHKGPKGSKGSHDNHFSSASADGEVGGDSHMWLHKTDGFGGISTWAEVAAYRGQALLGGGHTHAWVEPAGMSGQPSLTSFFPQRPDLRSLEGSSSHTKPWQQSYFTSKTAKDLQRFHLMNFLLEDKDDHGGNFVIDDDGSLTGIDRGMAGKYFDSSNTLVGELEWEAPAGFIDSGKGVPRKMLMAWAKGGDIPIAPLTDPEILDVIERAESIPDHVWDAMWRPYAESVKGGKLAMYSKNKKDKTVDGFIGGMIARLRTARKQMEETYTKLAAIRAATLKAKGDPRTLAEITKEVEDQLGLPQFRAMMGSKGSKATASAHHVADATDWSGNWDDPKLPATSKLPTIEHLRNEGIVGTEMAVPSDDVKGGNVELVMLDHDSGRVAAQFWMETSARAALQARLGWPHGGTGAVPTAPNKPEKPVSTPFTPPPVPAGVTSADSVISSFMGAAGVSSYAGMTKIGKYIDKWEKSFIDVGTAKGEKHLKTALNKAREMKKSDDPMTKAAGEHYEAELLRIGEETGPAGFTFKDPTTFKDADRKFKPFKPTAAVQKAAEAKHGDALKNHDKNVAEAKKAHEEAEKKKQEDYEKANAKWEEENKKFQEQQKAVGILPHTKHAGYRVPTAHTPSPGSGKADRKMKWNGQHKAGATIPGTHFEIDAGEGVKVFYVPGETTGKRSAPGVNGQTRIEFPPGATRKEIEGHMKRVGALLGIDLRPATALEHELSYLRRMAWIRSLEGQATNNKAKEPNGTTQQKIDFWIEQFKKPPVTKSEHYKGAGAGMKPKGNAMSQLMGGIGYDPRFEPEYDADWRPKVGADGKVVMKKDKNGNPVPNPSYRPIAQDLGGVIGRWRFDVPEGHMQKIESEGRALTHSAWGGGAGSSANARKMIRTGVYASNEPRQLRGLSGDIGQSPGTDRRLGGSYETYWNHSAKAGSHSGTISVSPRLLGYDVAYSNMYHDPYGTKQPAKHDSGNRTVLNRAATLHERKRIVIEVVANLGSGETTLRSKVDLRRWLVRVNASSDSDRQALLKTFQQHGVTEILGKKVSDVVVSK